MMGAHKDVTLLMTDGSRVTFRLLKAMDAEALRTTQWVSGYIIDDNGVHTPVTVQASQILLEHA